MSFKKIFNHFFILMALTTNISFLIYPHPIEIVITVFANLTATILKIGESRVLSTELLATSLVADLHLIPAIFVFFLGNVDEAISLAYGALAANIVSVILFVIETIIDTFTEE